MSIYNNITVQDAQTIIDDSSSIVIDIRDEQSYKKEHIHGAVRFNEKEILRMRKTPQRHSPVLIYCYHGNSSKDIATLLCNLGFSEVYNLAGGFTAWEAAHNKTPNSITPVEIKNPEVSFWLTSQGFNPRNINACNHTGVTPLMQACRMGLAETAKQLLKSGADINLTNDDGNNALWFSCYSENSGLISMLIENGINVNNRNITGATALIYASSAGKTAVVKQLLDAGANPFIRTQDDFTAQDLATTVQTYHLFRKLQPTG